MDSFTIRELRERTGELVRNAEEGRLSVVSKHGHPLFVALPLDARLLESGVAIALACRLFAEKALSLGKAARLAGLSLPAFIERLGAAGVAAADYDPAELKRRARGLELMRRIVADAGPLIVFSRGARLGLLAEVASQIWVARTVFGECVDEADRPGARELVEARASRLIRIAPDPAPTGPVGTSLGPGEIAVIDLARRLQCPVLMDDQLGRRVAALRGVAVVGGAGVLLGGQGQRPDPSSRPGTPRNGAAGAIFWPRPSCRRRARARGQKSKAFKRVDRGAPRRYPPARARRSGDLNCPAELPKGVTGVLALAGGTILPRRGPRRRGRGARRGLLQHRDDRLSGNPD